MKVVLVTGGIASGKSEVCRIFASRGIPVFDCDSRAKELYVDSEFCREISCALCGDDSLLGEDLLLDRAKLSSVVFADAEKLKILESMVHPRVLDCFREWKAAQKAPFVILESAIPWKTEGLMDMVDEVVEVRSDMALRLERAVQRDAASAEKVAERMRSQSFGKDWGRPCELIVNDSTLEALEARVDEVYDKLIID